MSEADGQNLNINTYVLADKKIYMSISLKVNKFPLKQWTPDLHQSDLWTVRISKLYESYSVGGSFPVFEKHYLICLFLFLKIFFYN